MEYKQPVPIRLYKDEIIELLLYFSVTQRFAGLNSRTAEISEKVYYNLDYKKQANLFEIIEFLYSLKTFQTIAISNTTKLIDVDLWEQKSDGQKLKFYSKEVLESETYRNVQTSEMAMPFSIIKDNPSQVFGNWLNNKRDLSSVYELYYNSVYVDNRYGRTEFLNIIFALETMHRTVWNGVSIEPDKYQEILNKIKHALTEEEQKLILDKMKYHYQYSLRKRLNELTIKFDFVLKRFEEKRGDFVNLIVNTRNYYVHFDHDLQGKVIDEKKFSYYNLIVKLLLDTFILSELGLPTESISLFVKKQRSLYIFH